MSQAAGLVEGGADSVGALRPTAAAVRRSTVGACSGSSLPPPRPPRSACRSESAGHAVEGPLRRFRPKQRAPASTSSASSSASLAQEFRWRVQRSDAAASNTLVVGRNVGRSGSTTSSVSSSSSSSSDGGDLVDPNEDGSEFGEDGRGAVSGSDADDGDADDATLLQELAASTGLPLDQVSGLLREYRTSRRGGRGATTMKQRRQSHPGRSAFVTEPPQPDSPREAGFSHRAEEGSPPQSPHSARAGASITARLEEFLPPPAARGGGEGDENDDDDALGALQRQRLQRQQARAAATASYLSRRRGPIEAPAALAGHGAFVARYEAEQRARREKAVQRAEAARRAEQEARRERFVRGFFSNMKIRERIEQQQQQQQRQRRPGETRLTTNSGSAAAVGV